MLTSLVFLFSTARTIKKYNTKKVPATLLKTQTYTNKAFGISFQYPISWTQSENVTYVINLLGDTTNIEVDFNDSLNNIVMHFVYNLSPKGFELYNYALEQYKTNKIDSTTLITKISVSGQNAIKTKNILTRNGKGNLLEKPITTINVIFLDKTNKGSYEFQFKPISNKLIEVNCFNNILLSVKFK